MIQNLSSEDFFLYLLALDEEDEVKLSDSLLDILFLNGNRNLIHLITFKYI